MTTIECASHTLVNSTNPLYFSSLAGGIAASTRSKSATDQRVESVKVRRLGLQTVSTPIIPVLQEVTDEELGGFEVYERSAERMEENETREDSDDKTASELQRMLNNWEGVKIDIPDGQQFAECDFCKGAIERGSLTTSYSSTVELNDSIPIPEGKIMMRNVYCSKCRIDSVRVPCKGVLEIICTHRITPDTRLVDWTVTDYSLRSEGMPWDPIEVMETHVVPGYIDDIMDKQGGAFGHSDIINHLRFYGIDPRDVINDDGTTNMDPERREDSLQKVMDVADEDESKYEIAERLRR